MNAPAKRFSLTRLMTSVPAEAKVEKPPFMGKLPSALEKPAASPLAAPESPAPSLAPPAAALPDPGGIEPSKVPPTTPVWPAKTKGPPKQAIDEAHPKKKRSYSVDMKVCEELEVLAWYQGRSSSSVVEELIRKYLSQNRSLLIKAQDIRDAR